MRIRRRAEHDGPLASMVDMMFGGVGVGTAFFLAFTLARMPGVHRPESTPRIVAIEIPSSRGGALGILIYAGGKLYANEESSSDDFSLRSVGKKRSVGLPFASANWILDLKQYRPTGDDFALVYLAVPPTTDSHVPIGVEFKVLGLPAGSRHQLEANSGWKFAVRLDSVLGEVKDVDFDPLTVLERFRPRISGAVNVTSSPEGVPANDVSRPCAFGDGRYYLADERQALGPGRRHSRSVLGYLGYENGIEPHFRSLSSAECPNTPARVPANAVNSPHDPTFIRSRWYSQFLFEGDALTTFEDQNKLNWDRACSVFVTRCAADGIAPVTSEIESIDQFYDRQRMEQWHLCARNSGREAKCALVKRESELLPILARKAFVCQLNEEAPLKPGPVKRMTVCPDLYDALISNDPSAASTASNRLMDVVSPQELKKSEQQVSAKELIIGGRGYWNGVAFIPLAGIAPASAVSISENVTRSAWVLRAIPQSLFDDSQSEEDWDTFYKLILSTDERTWPALGLRQHPNLWERAGNSP